MLQFKSFTGGDFATNCFLVRAPGGNILIDAPEDSDDHFAGEKIDLLLLTHGHFDHVADAAAVQRRHGCPVACHAETTPMITDPGFFRRLGFPMDIEPLQPDIILQGGPGQDFLGRTFDVLEVPGHCPGSLCFHSVADGILFGGDVLFAGGVGRWDLPGGDMDLLFRGIREKLYTLPDAVQVLPGHGPATTIGREKLGNPYVR